MNLSRYAKIFNIDRRSLFFSLLSGVLLVCSFPKLGLVLTAWVSLLPLFYAVRGNDIKTGIIAGFITGMVAYTGIMYWIAYVVVHYGYLSWVAGVGATLLLAAYMSLYVGAFAGGVVFFAGRGVPYSMSAPPLWVCLEYVKSHILTGFPWENLGYSQFECPALIQIADITGVYGVSFLVVAFNALLFESFLFWRGTVGKKGVVRVVLGVVLLAMVWVYGTWRIAQWSEEEGKHPVLEVSLVQGNVDQSVKWNPLYQAETMAAYISLSRQAAPRSFGLIIWPETAVPSFFQDKDDIHRSVVSLAGDSQAWLLFGSPSYRFLDGKLTLYNSAFLLSPDGAVKGRYDKVHLVPYGEYVPLRRFFPFIGKLVQGVGDFGTGEDYIPLAMNGVRVGVLICYEGIFPEASRRYKELGADLLVNITNDAWFGRTSAPYQHLSMTVFRAVETRMYVARAANTGVTAFIDPVGRIVARTGLFEATAIKGTLRPLKIWTFYGEYGDIFAHLCFVAVVAAILYSRRKRTT